MYWKDSKSIVEKNNEKAHVEGVGVAPLNVIGCLFLLLTLHFQHGIKAMKFFTSCDLFSNCHV